MATILGIDTSNYTTSVALYDDQSGAHSHARRLLPVCEGARGLRQSDAVFEHVRALPQLLQELAQQAGSLACDALCASGMPRRQQGSYMPCFLPGKTLGQGIALQSDLPFYEVSHQEGHILAGLLSADKLQLLDAPFLCLQLSGGTSELLHVTPGEGGALCVTLLSHTLDLSAGQLVDRIGVRMGLCFPAGPALDALSLQEEGRKRTIRTALKEGGFCLSGFENKANELIEAGESRAQVARFVLEAIGQTIDRVLDEQAAAYSKLPILFVGGVMANTLLRARFEKRCGAHFASPALSSDNAVGVAVLGSIMLRCKPGERLV